jgi:hypothetical protein
MASTVRNGTRRKKEKRNRNMEENIINLREINRKNRGNERKKRVKEEI